MYDWTILKFGSSVLRTEDDIPLAVAEIYREWRAGHRVIAVVSALGDTTDQLLARARRAADDPDPEALATLLSTGEATSVALLTLGLQRSGIPARVLDPSRIGLCVEGPPLDARPLDLDPRAVERALGDRPVAVIPGFVGRTRDGSPALLGRGGSDLTALFLAQRLGAGACRLIKDVDGIYEWDPARPGPAPARYRRVRWERAEQVGAELVQPKAVRFAASHGLTFHVAAVGAGDGTEVGPGPSERERPRPARRPLRVTLLGCGTVGGGLLQHLRTRPDRFEVVGIAVSHRARHRELPAALVDEDAWAVLRRPSDLVVELIGGIEPAASLIAEALHTGRDVVTANKAVVADRGPELLDAARRAGRVLRYSAAAGGSVPVLERLQRLSQAGPIRAVEGVLNGTCNFVLDRLAEGRTPAEAVAQAQALGFAEADPTLDLDGSDALHKLVLCASAAFGVWLDPRTLPRDGIDRLRPEVVRAAREQGQALRLVATLRRTPHGVTAEVGPTVLTADHPLAAARGAENRVVITPSAGPPVVLHGLGAGRWPTAEAVLADLTDVERLRQPGRSQRREAAA